MRAVFCLLALVLTAGCTVTKADRFAIEPAPVSASVRTSADSISIAKVNLPAYAKEPGIFVQDDSGAIVPVPKADWADDTERAMALALVRNLTEITGARVALDPWPLGGVPEAEVRVEVEQMLVDRTQTMRLSGQFSVRRDIATSRNRIRQFDINAPAASRSAQDIVTAHREAWQQLAQIMARSL